ncbi:MAG: hypothetical protein V1787_05405 [Candidatus Micrarchaeota archaeon]
MDSTEKSERRIEAGLFILTLAASAALVNVSDLRGYALLFAGTEAAAERLTLDLHNSQTPEFSLGRVGDAVSFGDKTYPLKFPGVFVIGAVPYTLIRAAGVSFSTDYALAAFLVSVLTTGLLTAAAAVCLYRLSRPWAEERWQRLMVALGYVFGSNVLVYAGVLHHAQIGGALSVIAFYLAMESFRGRSRHEALAGFAAGLAAITEPLTVFVSIPVFLYAASFSLKRARTLLAAALVPAAFFLFLNLALFGNPFLFAHAWSIQHFNEPSVLHTVPDFQRPLESYFAKAYFYVFSAEIGLATYSPFLFLGLFGLLFLPEGRLLREKLVFISSVVLLIVYVSAIVEAGNAQYGPRHLLPVMPFLAIGTTAYLSKKIPGIAVLAALAASVAIAVIGALNSSINMYSSFKYVQYAGQLASDGFPWGDLRFLAPGLAAAALGAVLMARGLAHARGKKKGNPSR